MEEIRADLPVGITVDQIADQPHVVEHSIAEFVKSFGEALAIVLIVSFLSLGLPHRHHRRALGAAGARHRLPGDGGDGDRPQPHHPRRADHRARAAGRRRDHRHRDDGGEDGAGLGPGERRRRGLGHHRLPDADRHAGDRRRLHPGRLRRLGGGRVRRRHLLGGGDRAGGLVVRRGDLHALSRGEAPAEPRAGRARTTPTRAGSTARCARAIDLCLRYRLRVVARDRGALRGGGARLRQRAAAVLPALGAAGAVPAAPPAGGLLDHRDDARWSRRPRRCSRATRT